MELLYYRAAAYCCKRQWEQATADLTQAIQLEPTNPRLLEARSAVWAARGNLKLAIADLREAVRLRPEPQLQEQLDSLLAQQASAEPETRAANRLCEAGQQPGPREASGPLAGTAHGAILPLALKPARPPEQLRRFGHGGRLDRTGR